MDKRRAQQRKRVAKKAGNLSAPVWPGRGDASDRGRYEKATAPPKTTTYMSYTLENTMISNYS